MFRASQTVGRDPIWGHVMKFWGPETLPLQRNKRKYYREKIHLRNHSGKFIVTIQVAYLKGWGDLSPAPIGKIDKKVVVVFQ